MTGSSDKMDAISLHQNLCPPKAEEVIQQMLAANVNVNVNVSVSVNVNAMREMPVDVRSAHLGRLPATGEKTASRADLVLTLAW
jgi:hypothetical protein